MQEPACYYLVKRGLYYGPDNKGYTGIRDHAGLYRKSQADALDGVTAVHKDEAPQFSEACWEDAKIQHLQSQLEDKEPREVDASRFGEDHCSRWEGIPQTGLGPHQRLHIEILSRGFGTGVWNILAAWGKLASNGTSGRYTKFIVNGRGGLATCDAPRLTRLVLAAHEEAVRVEISSHSFRHLKIEMWTRGTREGGLMTGHPGIQQAIRAFGRGRYA